MTSTTRWGLAREANDLLEKLSKTNKSIMTVSNGEIPSNLLDERDLTIQKLSELLDIRVALEDNGTATVTTPRGELLLLQNERNDLVLTEGYPDVTRLQLGVKTGPNTIKKIEQPGGALGGLIHARDGQLASHPSVNWIVWHWLCPTNSTHSTRLVSI